MRSHAACIVLCAMMPLTANADGSRLDLHYTPVATLGDDEVALKGDGFGGRVQVESGRLLVSLSYSTADYSVADDSVDQLRAGLGVAAGDAASVHAEYLDWDIFDTNADGFGAHLQLGQKVGSGPNSYLRVGYLWLEADDPFFGSFDIDGFEYAVGASFPLGAIRGLLEFRSSRLEDEFGDKLFLEDVHLGITTPFGN